MMKELRLAAMALISLMIIADQVGKLYGGEIASKPNASSLVNQNEQAYLMARDPVSISNATLHQISDSARRLSRVASRGKLEPSGDRNQSNKATRHEKSLLGDQTEPTTEQINASDRSEPSDSDDQWSTPVVGEDRLDETETTTSRWSGQPVTYNFDHGKHRGSAEDDPSASDEEMSMDEQQVSVKTSTGRLDQGVEERHAPVHPSHESDTYESTTLANNKTDSGRRQKTEWNPYENYRYFSDMNAKNHNGDMHKTSEHMSFKPLVTSSDQQRAIRSSSGSEQNRAASTVSTNTVKRSVDGKSRTSRGYDRSYSASGEKGTKQASGSSHKTNAPELTASPTTLTPGGQGLYSIASTNLGPQNNRSSSPLASKWQSTSPKTPEEYAIIYNANGFAPIGSESTNYQPTSTNSPVDRVTYSLSAGFSTDGSIAQSFKHSSNPSGLKHRSSSNVDERQGSSDAPTNDQTVMIGGSSGADISDYASSDSSPPQSGSVLGSVIDGRLYQTSDSPSSALNQQEVTTVAGDPQLSAAQQEISSSDITVPQAQVSYHETSDEAPPGDTQKLSQMAANIVARNPTLSDVDLSGLLEQYQQQQQNQAQKQHIQQQQQESTESHQSGSNSYSVSPAPSTSYYTTTEPTNLMRTVHRRNSPADPLSSYMNKAYYYNQQHHQQQPNHQQQQQQQQIANDRPFGFAARLPTNVRSDMPYSGLTSGYQPVFSSGAFDTTRLQQVASNLAYYRAALTALAAARGIVPPFNHQAAIFSQFPGITPYHLLSRQQARNSLAYPFRVPLGSYNLSAIAPHLQAAMNAPGLYDASVRQAKSMSNAMLAQLALSQQHQQDSAPYKRNHITSNSLFKPSASNRQYYYAPAAILSPFAFAHPQPSAVFAPAPAPAATDALAAVASYQPQLYAAAPTNHYAHMIPAPSHHAHQFAHSMDHAAEQYQALAAANEFQASYLDPDFAESSLESATSDAASSTLASQQQNGDITSSSSTTGNSADAASPNDNAVQASGSNKKGLVPWTSVAGLLLGIVPVGLLMASLLPVVSTVGTRQRRELSLDPATFSELLKWRPQSSVLNALIGDYKAKSSSQDASKYLPATARSMEYRRRSLIPSSANLLKWDYKQQLAINDKQTAGNDTIKRKVGELGPQANTYLGKSSGLATGVKTKIKKTMNAINNFISTAQNVKRKHKSSLLAASSQWSLRNILKFDDVGGELRTISGSQLTSEGKMEKRNEDLTGKKSTRNHLEVCLNQVLCRLTIKLQKSLKQVHSSGENSNQTTTGSKDPSSDDQLEAMTKNYLNQLMNQIDSATSATTSGSTLQDESGSSQDTTTIKNKEKILAQEKALDLIYKNAMKDQCSVIYDCNELVQLEKMLAKMKFKFS